MPLISNTAYTANDNGSISGLSNEITLSDTTLDVSVLNTLDSNTSGTIDASSILPLLPVLQLISNCLRLRRRHQSRGGPSLLRHPRGLRP